MGRDKGKGKGGGRGGRGGGKLFVENPEEMAIREQQVLEGRAARDRRRAEEDEEDAEVMLFIF